MVLLNNTIAVQATDHVTRFCKNALPVLSQVMLVSIANVRMHDQLHESFKQQGTGPSNRAIKWGAHQN